MTRRWPKIIGVATALLMLSGLAGGGMVLAQDPENEPPCCGSPRWRGLASLRWQHRNWGWKGAPWRGGSIGYPTPR
jgi:hypothetical protein